MKKILAFFLLALFMTAPALCARGTDLPRYTGFVNDYAGVLDSDQRSRLEELCRKLEARTSAEMAIAIVPSAEPLDSKGYAVKLFEQWKIGKKGKDNGILVLLAMAERRIEIEVGYGLEGTINDAKAGRILDQYVIPYFKEGKFGDGLLNGAAAIAEEIAKTASQEIEGFSPKRSSSANNEMIYVGIFVVGVLFFILSFVFFANLAIGLVGAFIGALIGFVLAGMIGSLLGGVIGFVILYAISLGGGWGDGSGGSSSGGDFFGGGFGGGGGRMGGGFGFGGGGSGGGGAGRSW